MIKVTSQQCPGALLVSVCSNPNSKHLGFTEFTVPKHQHFGKLISEIPIDQHCSQKIARSFKAGLYSYSQKEAISMPKMAYYYYDWLDFFLTSSITCAISPKVKGFRKMNCCNSAASTNTGSMGPLAVINTTVGSFERLRSFLNISVP